MTALNPNDAIRNQILQYFYSRNAAAISRFMFSNPTRSSNNFLVNHRRSAKFNAGAIQMTSCMCV